MRWSVSLAVALSLTACGDIVPDFPPVWQCAHHGNPRKFYCVNTKTKARKILADDSEVMKGAQCLSPEDYKKSEAWVATVKRIAERRCK